MKSTPNISCFAYVTEFHQIAMNGNAIAQNINIAVIITIPIGIRSMAGKSNKSQCFGISVS